MKRPVFFFLFCAGIFLGSFANAQLVTGVWRGKIDHRNVELKIVKNGDSLTGTSYYYTSAKNFKRYSIKGYFDATDNSVVWWDDQLIQEKNPSMLLPKRAASPYISKTEFNCPGGTKMYLTGKAAFKENPDEQDEAVELQKFTGAFFPDEWDCLIKNYTIGANDPNVIDSIGKLAFTRPLPVTVQSAPKQREQVAIHPKKHVSVPSKPSIKTIPTPVAGQVVSVPLTDEERFRTRTRQLVQEIPFTSDSLVLRFYDDAEIDGDSIAVFFNDKMLAQHIRLSDTAYIIKLPVEVIQQTNELVMVAENLGSIPPNTSLMIAIVDGRRYEARLASTENSSALIRFVRTENKE